MRQKLPHGLIQEQKDPLYQALKQCMLSNGLKNNSTKTGVRLKYRVARWTDIDHQLLQLAAIISQQIFRQTGAHFLV